MDTSLRSSECHNMQRSCDTSAWLSQRNYQVLPRTGLPFHSVGLADSPRERVRCAVCRNEPTYDPLGALALRFVQAPDPSRLCPTEPVLHFEMHLLGGHRRTSREPESRAILGSSKAIGAGTIELRLISATLIPGSFTKTACSWQPHTASLQRGPSHLTMPSLAQGF
ncbi:hypothetical protein CC79DRAFT_1336218 [Sarocladium strictum]